MKRHRALAVLLLAAACAPDESPQGSTGASGAPPTPPAPPTTSAAAPPVVVAAPAVQLEPRVVSPPALPWTEDELRRIDEGLDVVNASRSDLGFQKQPIDDPFRLEVVRRALDDPLSVGREAAAWDVTARAAPSGLCVLLSRAITTLAPSMPPHGPRDSKPRDVSAADSLAESLPESARKDLEILIDLIANAADDADRTFSALTAEDRDALLRKALLSQVEHPAVVPGGKEIDDAAFLAMVPKAGTAALQTRACSVASQIEQLVRDLRAVAPGQIPGFLGTRRANTAIGDVVLYGSGDDVHPADESAVLVIDLGGNDTYVRGASANLLESRPVSVVIDLAGDDRYVGGSDLSFGGALGGIAIQYDCGGNDTYIAGNCSLGAGILGVGVLVDEGGDDVFRAKDFCEGAGAFGIGVLMKKGGNDLYHADRFGQGYATTWGCGVLVDTAGNDTYDAGGAHVHAPLYRDRFQSLSQGFAIGMRPDASGGVGVLVDVAGNDRYVADIYAQGSSYWYSLGLLIDDDGNDTYVAGQYSCGSGIHLSAGMLLDGAGNDSYHCMNGVGVGGAHDFGVGFLVDRGGDDHYSGSGGSQGGALTNSVAMLIDDAGDDGYCAVRDGTQGFAAPARNSGGIGLFLDGGGKDVYSERTRDEGVWIRDTVGAGIDSQSVTSASGEPQAAAISQADAEKKVDAEGKVEKDGTRVWDLDKLWALASEWEVNDNRVIVPIAKERLWALGAPALDRAFERLGSAATGSGLEFRAVETTIVHFAADVGDGSTDGALTTAAARAAIVARLLEKTRDPAVPVRKGAVSVLATLKAEEAVDRLVEMLGTDEPTRRAVLAALGVLKKAPPAVAALLRSKSELEGVNAAVCLGAAAATESDGTSVAALLGALGADTPFLVRTAATEQLAALGDKSIIGLSKLAQDAAAPVMARRNALRALGKCRHVDAVDPIVNSFLAKDRWVRLSAYQAAAAFLPTANETDRAEVAASLAAARNLESDPLLKRLR